MDLCHYPEYILYEFMFQDDIINKLFLKAMKNDKSELVEALLNKFSFDTEAFLERTSRLCELYDEEVSILIPFLFTELKRIKLTRKFSPTFYLEVNRYFACSYLVRQNYD